MKKGHALEKAAEDYCEEMEIYRNALEEQLTASHVEEGYVAGYTQALIDSYDENSIRHELIITNLNTLMDGIEAANPHQDFIIQSIYEKAKKLQTIILKKQIK